MQITFTSPNGIKRTKFIRNKDNIIGHHEINKITEYYTIPKGYKLVPIEPTEEIIQSGCMEIGDIEVFDSLDCVNTYKAMIEAAPNIEDINE